MANVTPSRVMLGLLPVDPQTYERASRASQNLKDEGGKLEKELHRSDEHTS